MFQWFVLYETGTFLWVIPLQWEERSLRPAKMSRIPEVQKDIWPWQRSATKGPFAPSLIWWLPSGSGERWSPSFHVSFKYYLYLVSIFSWDVPPRLFAKRWLDLFKTFIPPSQLYKITISRRCFSYDFTYFFLPRMIPATTIPGWFFIGQGSVRRFRGPSRMLRNSFAWPSPQCLGQRRFREDWRCAKKGSKGLEVQVILHL